MKKKEPAADAVRPIADIKADIIKSLEDVPESKAKLLEKILFFIKALA